MREGGEKGLYGGRGGGEREVGRERGRQGRERVQNEGE